MPPARGRVPVDDARSDISTTNPKDRIVSVSGVPKGKKTTANTLGASLSTSKTAAAALVNTVAVGSSTVAVNQEQDHPHIDWSTLPVHSLQNYRSTYRLQIPSAYTRPHAELLYNSCDLALRAPSRVLARRKAHDLRTYRKKTSQPVQDTRNSTNGVSKTTKGSRSKEKKSGKNKDKHNTADEAVAALSAHEQIEGPPSPNSHPSQHESNSTSTDNASRVSRTASVEAQEDEADSVPITLNQANPEATVIGSTSANTLSTTIRKHFNAQQLNEPETIARFSYVVRQLGSATSSRTLPLAQRNGPLPPTTAELIAGTAARAAQAASDAAAGSMPITINPVAGLGITAPAIVSAKNAAHAAYSLSAPRTVAGNHIQVEGSYGDGRGWVMGTTSCGRQVRMSDSVGGGGTFRLRFRPAPWGQEVVGHRTGT